MIIRRLTLACILAFWPSVSFPQTQSSAKDAVVAERLAVLDRQIADKTIDLNEMKRQRAALAGRTEPKQKNGGQLAAGTSDFESFQRKLLRENSDYKPEPVAQPKAPFLDPCEPQRFFIRADSLDSYLYGITPASKAVGASVSYTNDQVAKTQNINIKGMVSYVALRNLCPDTPAGDLPYVSGYSVATYVQGDGSLTAPRSKKEQSFAKTGIEAQVEVSRGFPLRQVFTFSPYYLTDYRGEARAQGINAYWDMYDANLHLGGYISGNPMLDWFVQLRGEADVRSVDAVGVTNLTKRDYAWVGGTIRASFFLFPSDMNVDPAFRNRISFVGEASWFSDLRAGAQIHKYIATAKYNISEQGNSSVQLQYTHGTDKETLVFMNQVMVKLSYAY